MIYTEKTMLAMKIAYKAHNGQFDKSGLPYIYHPIHLAEQCKDEDTTIVALLHDVIEDCPSFTFDYLKSCGFKNEIIEAIQCMTHKKNVPYMDYIYQIKQNEIAREVKLLDLRHNLDETRFPLEIRDEMLEKMKKKREKYKQAIKILEK